MSAAHELMSKMRFPHDGLCTMVLLMTTFQPHTERSWRRVAPGVDFSILRTHGTEGLTLLVRMAAGADAQLHDHPGGEETYLLSGKLRIDGHCLLPGDYLWTPPGVAHAGHAEEESIFFVVLPAGLRPIDPPAQRPGDDAA
jgi:quercetin dioxygenase-like cupin family protein